MSCFLRCSGGERGLLGLVLFRHLLGVAAGGLRVLEFLVFDREEFGPEALHLLLGRGPHVSRGDDGAKPPRGSDRLQAGDANAHHEHFCRGNRAGGGHHHRKGAAESFRGLDHRAIAGEVRLRRQHVHYLGAGDARHQFHRKGRHAGIRNRLQRGLIAIWVHDGDDQRATLVLRQLAGLGPLHLDDDVGVLQRIGAHRGACRGEFRIRQAGFDARARLDRHFGAQRLEFLHGVGGSGHPRLGRIDFLGNGNLHGPSGGAVSARASKLALFSPD